MAFAKSLDESIGELERAVDAASAANTNLFRAVSEHRDTGHRVNEEQTRRIFAVLARAAREWGGMGYEMLPSLEGKGLVP